ncbi:DNA replication and repair protein RecR [Breznakibacter xylanolyticus]|uniref:Recombination protein RecR n=1 Tax=Breznakibacter xylanolyticus TaxID=990 RepID=A0A2W7NLA4_9BACT|nr:recombination mediator RecR [Breznakibacter xylanolyticus]PZX20660.1 DNA replication and repair protein RecR [Breznakibacter xylanolyticus]
MSSQTFPSKLLENAVNEFSRLPGIGKKTALRLVLYLLRQDKGVAVQFSDAIRQMREEIKYCKVCHNISDTDVCSICSTPSRDGRLVCVVESVKDVMAIENTQQYHGVYHVLGGVISPMDGIGPNDLSIGSLEARVKDGTVAEVIFALPTTMEGDTTNFYLYRKLEPYQVKITTIARGVAIGDELEYIDEVTLGRSLVNRQLFSTTL